jgi:diamine N-acetyltransferase
MNMIKLKQLSISDLDQLEAIARETFFQTFHSINTEENMRKYLDEGFSTDKLSKELNDKNSLFYFAMIHKRVIGYLKINFGLSQTEFHDDSAVEIERLYVLSEFHGKKVGQILFEKAVEIASKRNADYIWLGVWEHNPRAISFYKKNGFIEFDKHIFKLGDDEQTDILMRLRFKGS